VSRVTSHLTAELLRADEAPWGPPGAWRPPRADHVVLDAHDGTVALLAFEALGGGRVACERALVAGLTSPSGPDDSEDLSYLQAMAARSGLWFARPGSAPCGMLHRLAFAAPGAAVCGPAAVAGAGAFGMLAWTVGPLESATALAGHALPFARPPVVGVRLEGALPLGVCGLDVLVAAIDALGPHASGAVLECHGGGVAALEMDERVAFASQAARAGALAAVFPADDCTRAAMRAMGREDDWRRFEGGTRGFDHSIELVLDRVVPRPLPAAAALVLGPEAEDDAVRRVRAGLAAAGRALMRPVEWLPAGRVQRDALRADGTLAALESMGVRVREPGEGVSPRVQCAWLGSDRSPLSRTVSAAGAVALALGLTDAAAASEFLGEPRLERGTPLPTDVFVPAAEVPTTPVHGTRHRLPTATRGHRARSRGVAVASAAGPPGASLLPRGPRLEAVRAEGEALAGWLLHEQDPAAAQRARAHGGGMLLVGEALAAGPEEDTTARALAALGVHVVLAEDIGAGTARRLALHGVLPLTWEHPSHAALVRVGDELEITSTPAALEAGSRVAVRDLTRGVTLPARAALDPRLVAIAREGGLLATCARTGASERGGDHT